LSNSFICLTIKTPKLSNFSKDGFEEKALRELLNLFIKAFELGVLVSVCLNIFFKVYFKKINNKGN